MLDKYRSIEPQRMAQSLYITREKKSNIIGYTGSREAKARSQVFQLYNQQEKICIKTRYDITSRCFWYAVNVELITRDFARSSTSRRFKQKSDSPDITMRIPARYDGPTDILYINSSYDYTCVLICITSTGDTWKASARVKKKKKKVSPRVNSIGDVDNNYYT